MRRHYALVPCHGFLVCGHVDTDPTVTAAYVDGDSQPLHLPNTYTDLAKASLMDEHRKVSAGYTRSCPFYRTAAYEVVKAGALSLGETLAILDVNPSSVTCRTFQDTHTVTLGHRFLTCNCRPLGEHERPHQHISTIIDEADHLMQTLIVATDPTEKAKARNAYDTFLEDHGWTHDGFRDALVRIVLG